MATQQINKNKWLDIQKQLPEGHQSFNINLSAANDKLSQNGTNAENLINAENIPTPRLNPSQSSFSTAGYRTTEGQCKPTQKRRKRWMESAVADFALNSVTPTI